MSYRRRYPTRLPRATKIPFRRTPAVRFGPRPSQRPSRASWPLTKTLDFLSRPLPLPRPCANADVDNRHNIRVTNAILNAVILIRLFLLLKSGESDRAYLNQIPTRTRLRL